MANSGPATRRRHSTASHGEEALAIVSDPLVDDPDTIIRDPHMDRMDGMEFCNKVRRSDRIRRRAIPILMLTGDGDEMRRAVSRQVGAAKVLNKPIASSLPTSLTTFASIGSLLPAPAMRGQTGP